MKRAFLTALSLALAVIVCACVMPVAAAYQWEDGKLPEGWTSHTDESEIVATDILTPNNPNATREAKNLLAYLSYVGNSTDTLVAGTFDYMGDKTMVKQLEGQYAMLPGMYSTFYQVCDPKYNESEKVYKDSWGTVVDGLADEAAMTLTNVAQINATAKEMYDRGAILLLFASSTETWFRDYMVETGVAEEWSAANGCMHFDITNPDRDMATYAYWQKYVDGVVAALKALEDSGVSAYLYRPFIEFNGNARYINGVDQAGYEAFVRVQQQFFQSLVDGGLTGFLLTWTPAGGAAAGTFERYPGNAYVDVVSCTAYPLESADGSMEYDTASYYDWFCATGKPLGLSETSSRTGSSANAPNQPRASWLNTLKSIVNLWPRMSYACGWGNAHYSLVHNEGTELSQQGLTIKNGNDDGLLFLASPFALTLDEIPDYKVGTLVNPGIAQLFAKADRTGAYVGLEQRVYNRADLKRMGISLTDIRSVHVTDGYMVNLHTEKDGGGEAYSFNNSFSAVDGDLAASCQSVSVQAMANIAFEKDVWASSRDDDAWKVNDGGIASWEGAADEKGEAWVMMDLGDTYSVERYVLQLAGSVGYPESFNLRDFRLEVSEDNRIWKTVDTVTGNTASSLERMLTGVSGRYVRLYITGANSTVTESTVKDVLVSEWEIYGLLMQTATDEPEQPPAEDSDDEPDSTDSEDTSAEELPGGEEPEDTGSEDVSTEPEEDVDKDDLTEESYPEDTDIPLTEDDDQPDESLPTDESDTEDTVSDDADEDEKHVVKVQKQQVVTNWPFIWGMVILGVVVAAAVLVTVWLLCRRKKKAQTAADTE